MPVSSIWPPANTGDNKLSITSFFAAEQSHTVIYDSNPLTLRTSITANSVKASLTRMHHHDSTTAGQKEEKQKQKLWTCTSNLTFLSKWEWIMFKIMDASSSRAGCQRRGWPAEDGRANRRQNTRSDYLNLTGTKRASRAG